ncbi:MAG: hypothetical protein ABI572_03655 [Actinomycetota bacterium]
MRDDDELIRAYETELSTQTPTRRANRGFWLVLGTLILASILMLVEIFANRPIANTIGHAQYSLRVAQAGADRAIAERGTFAGADAEGLTSSGIGDADGLTFVGPDQPSQGLDSISVYASGTEWAAAVTAEPNACFYLRLRVGEDVRYGVGTVCTAEEARSATDPRW